MLVNTHSLQHQRDTKRRDCVVPCASGFASDVSGAACCMPCVGAAGLHTSRCQLL